jgi:hypothetical protein
MTKPPEPLAFVIIVIGFERDGIDREKAKRIALEALKGDDHP